MKSENILILTGLIGLISFILLPSFLKIFAFLIPAIAICNVFYDKFNWTLFLFLTLLFILFPSSLLTFDTSLGPQNYVNQVYSKNDYYELNLTEAFDHLNDIQYVIINIIVFVIPILLLISGIYAIMGRPRQRRYDCNYEGNYYCSHCERSLLLWNDVGLEIGH